jgi:2-methylcitrate dehydratase
LPLRRARVHPSDTLCALLSVAQYASSLRAAAGGAPLRVRDLLTALVKAYEIAGLLACDNALNAVGVDGGPLFTKVASAAVCTALLGGGRREVAAAASHAFVDGASLRAFRHAPACGGRAAWGGADGGARAVWLALAAARGEPGIPLALSAPVWGFHDVFFRRAPLTLPAPLAEHVAPRVLFRAALPGEAHAAAAAEAALPLHPLVCHRVDEVTAVVVHTCRAGVRAADRTGPLGGAVERAHCMQYAVCVALLYGSVTSEHYGDAVAADPRLEELRRRTAVAEHPPFTAEYADASSRALPAAVQVHFADRSATPQAALTFPLGHAARRTEGFPALRAKLLRALRARFPARRAGALYEQLTDAAALDELTVPELLDALADPPLPYVAAAMRAPPVNVAAAAAAAAAAAQTAELRLGPGGAPAPGVVRAGLEGLALAPRGGAAHMEGAYGGAAAAEGGYGGDTARSGQDAYGSGGGGGGGGGGGTTRAWRPRDA